MSLTGRLRRVNGSVRTVSQPRSRRRIGIRLPRDQYLLREDARSRNQSRGGRARRLAASSITATLVAAALIVTYFRAEVAAYVTRYAGHEDTTYQRARRAGWRTRVRGKATWLPTDRPKPIRPARQRKRSKLRRCSRSRVSVPEAQQSLKEDRAEGGRRSLRRPDALSRGSMGSSGRKQRRAHDRSKEREKATALALEAGAARKELAASTEQHRQALDEERMRSIGLGVVEGTVDEARQLKQAEAQGRAIARRGARKNGRSRAGGRRRATRADREHSATSSSDRRGTRA